MEHTAPIRGRLAWVAAVGLLMSGGAAFGQSVGIAGGDDSAPAAPKDVRPPAPAEPGKPALVVPYLLIFALGAAAVGLAVMPSHRTHQD